MDPIKASWRSTSKLPPRGYTCGYCNKVAGTDKGWYTHQLDAEELAIYICSYCQRPSFFEGDLQVPGATFGNDVAHVPQELGTLYQEARNCIAASAFTSAVLACRKLLMNIAVAQNADEGKPFAYYVDYLASQGYVPPNGRRWVDLIRKRGNEANHEIKLMSRQDAEELVMFSEMLLKFIYEFPARVPQSP